MTFFFAFLSLSVTFPPTLIVTFFLFSLIFAFAPALPGTVIPVNTNAAAVKTAMPCFHLRFLILFPFLYTF